MQFLLLLLTCNIFAFKLPLPSPLLSQLPLPLPAEPPLLPLLSGLTLLSVGGKYVTDATQIISL